MAAAVVIVKRGKRCLVCGEDVGALGAVEVIVVMSLKWLVVVVAKRSSVGCCGDFWKAFVVILVSVVASW